MIKITLEATGYNKQTLTDKDIEEQGIFSIVNLIVGWLCIFYNELFYYTLQKNKDSERDL